MAGVPSLSGRFSSLQVTGVRLTGRRLGKGSDATVEEVEWQGTFCAAKILHEILLDDDSPGGSRRFVEGFEKECLTWSKLSHPHVAQFLGVYFRPGSTIPILLLEKMDTSLRTFLEENQKEDFGLSDKIFILLQVVQGLAYLHSRKPALVHHDLSPNNILLNREVLLAKLTDFGMSRVVDFSGGSRKSSVKGTQAFMSPEALVEPPHYDEKLDVFSFGNVIITTLTLAWPNPGASKSYKGDKLIALSEFERREQHVIQFSPEESAVFVGMVRSCLEDRPNLRPTSLQLVGQMRQIEKDHPRKKLTEGPAVMEQLHAQLRENATQLQAKDTQLRENATQLRENATQLQAKDTQLRENATQLQAKDTQLQAKDTQLQENATQLWEKDTQLRENATQLLENATQLQAKDTQLRENATQLREKDTLVTQLLEEHQRLQQENNLLRRAHQKPSSAEKPTSSSSPAKPFKPGQSKPPMNWRELKCQKTLECGGLCYSVAVQGDVVCVGVVGRVLLFSKTSGAQVSELGLDQIVSYVNGVAFIDEDTIVVSADKRLRTYTTKGQLVLTFDSGKDWFYPTGLTVGPDGHIFVCDYGNHCVRVFNVDGKLLSSFGSKGSGVGHFNLPWDVCMDGEGLLFISDWGNRRICVHSVEGAFIREFPTPRKPHYVAATHCNHLVVSSLLLHTVNASNSSGSSYTVMIMTTSGQLVHEFGGEGNGPGKFIGPYGVAVDSEDCVYVCDGGNCVQVY